MNTFVQRETQLRYVLVNEAFFESNKSILQEKEQSSIVVSKDPVFSSGKTMVNGVRQDGGSISQHCQQNDGILFF